MFRRPIVSGWLREQSRRKPLAFRQGYLTEGVYTPSPAHHYAVVVADMDAAQVGEDPLSPVDHMTGADLYRNYPEIAQEVYTNESSH